ncbi:MAG: SDR family NAD(P)-dependent oxidoreductase [Actinobacteria bacterium]|nr:SDR family NAD(P)-dependent oxidoreductase [Actinomycetota bacterium]MBU4218227.1 SDR family NAD(P)-dependent oxidoreductase [Actinomycetota bacterium]MBU4358652.1 SDR family NAD(P)-dependent oxidoreductase [Actinomycetota bacterium]MCG2818584.1 SDR family NAD(P)-dependent oxidoreductase [Actinomycetes bacterium]
MDLESDLGGVDVLVNVACVAVVGEMVDTTVEDWEWVIGVNLWGPINTISALLPGMLERENGYILNVASLGGLVSHGLLLAYCTTKFGLVGLSEALYQQVREHNVHVTAFCPGIIRTPIAEHMKLRGYSSDKVNRSVSILMKSPITMSADRTGDLIVRAVKKQQPLVVTTVTGKLLAALHRLSPGLVRFLLTKAHKLDNATLR